MSGAHPGLQGVGQLDPDLAAFALRPCGSLADVDAVRHETAAFVAARPPSSFAVTCEDIVLPCGPGVRIYRPAAAPPGPLPVILHFHGGAFVIGSPAVDDPLCSRYAEAANAAVVSVDYRLAPEHRCPAALDDGYITLDWIATQGRGHDLDAAHIAISGSSAGGALAAGVALLARDRGGPPIALMMLAYPVLDDRLETRTMRAFTDTPVFARHAAVAMWRHYLGGATASQYAAPARAASLNNLPPTHLEICGLDPLRDEGAAFAERLVAAGVPVTTLQFDGTPHGFDQDYLGAPPSSAAFARAMAARGAVLNAALHPQVASAVGAALDR